MAMKLAKIYKVNKIKTPMVRGHSLVSTDTHQYWQYSADFNFVLPY
jgi:hypothetical protein